MEHSRKWEIFRRKSSQSWGFAPSWTEHCKIQRSCYPLKVPLHAPCTSAPARKCEEFIVNSAERWFGEECVLNTAGRCWIVQVVVLNYRNSYTGSLKVVEINPSLLEKGAESCGEWEREAQGGFSPGWASSVWDLCHPGGKNALEKEVGCKCGHSSGRGTFWVKSVAGWWCQDKQE